jgi:hypothetical protein
MSYFKKARHVRAETEAAERSDYSARQQAQERAEAARRQSISKIIGELKPIIAEAIKTASGNRLYEITHSVSQEDEEWEALNYVAEELREDGYEASIEKSSVDHGDSAAPAVCHYYELKVSWRRSE